MVPTNAYYDRLAEQVCRKVLDEQSVVVDAGCHRGEVLKTMMKHAPGGRFLAFEPIPELFAELEQTFNDPRFSLHCLALGRKEGSAPFNLVESNPAYSGLVKRRYDRDGEIDRTITVQTARLDPIIDREKPGPVDLIKIDVEGGEYHVLEGARETLDRDRPFILFEHGPGGSDCYGIGPEDLYELLAVGHDYRIYRLADWLKRKPALEQASFCREFHHGWHYFYLAEPAESV